MSDPMTLEVVAKIAKLSADHFGCLEELTKSWLMRSDGIPYPMKIVSLISADLKHLKVLHLVGQTKIQENMRVPFSAFLHSMALEEEREEANAKGGA